MGQSLRKLPAILACFAMSVAGLFLSQQPETNAEINILVIGAIAWFACGVTLIRKELTNLDKH